MNAVTPSDRPKRTPGGRRAAPHAARFAAVFAAALTAPAFTGPTHAQPATPPTADPEPAPTTDPVPDIPDNPAPTIDTPIAPDANTVNGVQTHAGALTDDDETLEFGEHVDVYPVTVQPGERLRVELASDAFDTYLVLIAPDGELFENDDAQDSIDRSFIDVLEATPGDWVIQATSLGPATGPYTLRVTRSPAPELQTVLEQAGALAEDDTPQHDGRVADTYRLRLGEGTRVLLDASSDAFAPMITLIRPDGTVLASPAFSEASAARLDVTAPAAGEYRLFVVNGWPGEYGAYALRVRRVPTTDNANSDDANDTPPPPDGTNDDG